MTQMPLVAAIALIVTAVLFVVGIITLIVGFATHRVSMESPLADDDDNDDLSDDTATLLSMLPGASVVVDEHDEVVRCNPAAYRLGVVSDDAIAQQHVLDAIHEARKSGGKRQFDLTTDTPERYVADQNKGDHVATQSVHRPNWLKVTVGRINEQFVIVLITDVSDVIRFAQVRDSFITNVSEQLLAPTEALAKLADSLESGNLEQLRATAARLEPQAAEAGVQLNIKGDDDLVINGEADQIDSAVTKLIENAIGYSKENGVVSVSASKDKDGDRAVIRVIDQGTGIAKKDQARIFERFYRGVEQSNRTADGVGLGLAIVKHVALTHHGDVTVWSAPGQGSTFSLTLPLAQ